ncbi:MAG: O-methyltransferase [Candidatus Eremiobacteraeota bacterium]|nr:O-methyltransferase [Candidatus Eremiobacteraeota bacterium]MBV8366559.1 O-methyltransferase [Candidatus Eremiobacteraeota bacterium]
MIVDHPLDPDFTYLRTIHTEPDALMLELEAAGARDEIPIVSREVGRFLSVMASAMLASNILEVGTAYGCSTLWMARAQPETGRIWTIDPDAKRTDIARDFFRRAGVADRIEIFNQPALDVMGRLPKNIYDIVLLDALKEEYSDYLKLAIPLLKHSGLVIVDNLLWHHRAATASGPNDDKATTAIRAFNTEFLRNPALNATILPLGDGVGVGAKIA